LLPAAAPARVGIVAWEGDQQLADDRVLLDGAPLSTGNAFLSRAAGAVGPATAYGVDIVEYPANLRDEPVISLTTKGDAYVAGVVTVTVPLRS
ncbi:hypothetical protein, partial [Actinocorallia lasiicapitis]